RRHTRFSRDWSSACALPICFTFQVIENGKAHEIAAAFTFGREDLIPAMFTEILKGLNEKFPDIDLSELVYYFERHIELDADEHGPMYSEMMSYLCNDEHLKWDKVLMVAQNAIKKLIKLRNAKEALIDQEKKQKHKEITNCFALK